MSFTQQVKKEIARHEVNSPCCILAACYGVACFAKSFGAGGLALHTESAFIAQWAKRLFAQAGITGRVYVKGTPAHSYVFTVKEPYEVEKMLVSLAHTGAETTLRINPANLECEGCFAQFVTAAFMCAGIVAHPEKGYALEFVSARYTMTRDFAELLRQHGFAPGRASRKGTNVVYFRASEQVEDLLTLMGAGKSTLEIMNLKVYKDIRNKANRITNCETANIDKTVNANRQVLEAIAFLERQGALDTLPGPLKSAAALRKANPDMSLEELRQAMDEPVSKSGLNHRYRRIVQLASDLKSKRESENRKEEP